MITPEEFNTIGTAIFGRLWRHQLARAIDVDERTIRRWAVDGAPDKIVSELEELFEESRKNNHAAFLALAAARARQEGKKQNETA